MSHHSVTPRITAIITTYNRAAFLARAIESVLAQTFPDFELLVLDNASSDGTGGLVAGYGDRLRLVRHAPLSIGGARNLGIALAKGAYVAFLDDDDEWLPGKLEAQVRKFEDAPADVALIYGGFVRVDSAGNEFARHRPVLRGHILKDLLWQWDAFTGSASNPMLRTAALRQLGGYNERLSASEDWELYLRLAERFVVDYVDPYVARIRTHATARLGDKIAAALEVEELVLERYRATMDRRLQSFYLQHIGGKLCRIGDPVKGRGRLLEAIRLDPMNWLAYAQLGLSVLGTRAYRWAHSRYQEMARH